ncbi:hypothetical protein PP175_27265 (plasmid) [Aneurinibacillus sp. Ricciae_BoGa-3]|uniref:hypothetical protein n=1 Tax=Aneurinibacillus sp. Ricciae_BoGa-3 TaxID=3022697 RepID=UPI0023421067|nr:hypothetical protein [Aneurinibacillus sp. Ricciae_BoGa-3]WCK57738.1 hypothetical protein PP175_27265 [Aneurinibacillus sp. Ricciae_BoGa-3]
MEEKEFMNEPELKKSKIYFMDATQMAKVTGKGSLMAVLGISMFGIMFSGITWWAKALFGLGGLFAFVFTFYDMKYMMGLRKNPFQSSFNNKTFQYFNEFEGNKVLDVDQIREIKVYRRAKDAFLLEIFLNNKVREENVNIAGFDAQTKQEMLDDLKAMNPTILFTSYHKDEEAK